MVTSRLVLTPLRTPPLDGICARPRLFQLLDSVRAKPILWIGGGPGTGKSALLASYLAEHRLRGVWYHAELEENVIAAASIKNAGPQSGAEIGRGALRELWSGVAEPGMVLVEDCHEMPFESRFHTLLANATQKIPAGVTIVLIGRGEPPAAYARLIANGSMAVLAGEELQFSLQEARSLLTAVVPDDEAIAALHSRCAGWAAGIALAFGASRRYPADSEQAELEFRRTVFGYFAAEVFEQMTSQERQVLVSTALVPRLCSRTAETLTGSASGWGIVNRLVRRQLFLKHSAAETASCEHVPLFREFLLTRIEDELSPEELGALATRAGKCLEQSPLKLWLADCELLQAHSALRRGDHIACHQLLRQALRRVQYLPSASEACMLFAPAVGEVCNEALSAGIAIESAQWLIQRYRLPPPPAAAPDWPWAFRVHMLGRFRLLKEGTPVRFSRRTQRKPLELLQALIAFGGTEVGSGALIDALWPDSEGDAGYHALESALYRLRRLLGTPDAVRMAGGKLTLDRRQVWVDMWELERELHTGARAEPELDGHITRIRQLYEGHFLEHESEKAWALKTRQALRERFLRHLRNAAFTYENRRAWREAARLYQTALELDPLSEDFHRGLMVCYRELGDHSEALQAYRRCRELLTRLLGVPPNAKTQAIYHSVRESAVAQPG